MPVQTRQQKLNEQKLASKEKPVIMVADEPEDHDDLGESCHTENEHCVNGGKTNKEISKGPSVSEDVYAAVKALGDVDPMTAAAFALGFVAGHGQIDNTDECPHFPQEKTHGLAWTANVHYMSIGGQCGQSCGCCRADVYKSGRDDDAKWGACSICLST